MNMGKMIPQPRLSGASAFAKVFRLTMCEIAVTTIGPPGKDSLWATCGADGQLYRRLNSIQPVSPDKVRRYLRFRIMRCFMQLPPPVRGSWLLTSRQRKAVFMR